MDTSPHIGPVYEGARLFSRTVVEDRVCVPLLQAVTCLAAELTTFSLYGFTDILCSRGKVSCINEVPQSRIVEQRGTMRSYLCQRDTVQTWTGSPRSTTQASHSAPATAASIRMRKRMQLDSRGHRRPEAGAGISHVRKPVRKWNADGQAGASETKMRCRNASRRRDQPWRRRGCAS